MERKAMHYGAWRGCGRRSGLCQCRGDEGDENGGCTLLYRLLPVRAAVGSLYNGWLRGEKGVGTRDGCVVCLVFCV